MSKQILVFGDSVAYGAWDEAGGWVERLKCKIHRKVISSDLEFYCDVYNLSIDGDHTGNLLERFEFEVRQRTIEGETIIIFAIGINDSCFIKSRNAFLTPSGRFRENIEKMIGLSGMFNSSVMFLGFTPVDESKVDPVPLSRIGACYKNEYIKKYDNILRSVCLEKNTDFIGIYDEFCRSEYKKFLFDGIHPNSGGHEKIYNIVDGYLEKKKIV